MQLMIDNEPRNFVPIGDFRKQFDLPQAFGMQLYMHGDITMQGRIRRLQDEMQLARQDVLDALPEGMPLRGWVAFLPHLTRLFTDKLHEINTQLQMRREQIDQAVTAFNQVCQAFLYARIQSRGGEAPALEQVYQDWLNKSVQIAPQTHSYIHNGHVWAVQLVTHALGPCGLIVWTPDDTYYVADHVFACPVEPFLVDLLQEIARHIAAPDATAGIQN